LSKRGITAEAQRRRGEKEIKIIAQRNERGALSVLPAYRIIVFFLPFTGQIDQAQRKDIIGGRIRFTVILD